ESAFTGENVGSSLFWPKGGVPMTRLGVATDKKIGSTATTRTSVPAGQVRRDTSATAASASGDPSSPITIRIGRPGCLARAILTEQVASRINFRETLPRRTRASPDRPWVPATIRFGDQSAALSRMAVDACPAGELTA